MTKTITRTTLFYGDNLPIREPLAYIDPPPDNLRSRAYNLFVHSEIA